MSCKRVNKNLLQSCFSTIQGVQELYIANLDSISGFTLDTTETMVSGLTIFIESGYTSGAFYKVFVNRESGEMASTNKSDPKSRTASYTPKVSFKIASLESDNLAFINDITQSQVVVIGKQNSITPKYFIAGLYNGLTADQADESTGMASQSDMGGTFVLSGLEPTGLLVVPSDLISGLLVTL